MFRFQKQNFGSETDTKIGPQFQVPIPKPNTFDWSAIQKRIAFLEEQNETNINRSTQQLLKLYILSLSFQGNYENLQKMTGWTPNRVLYFGDHPYADLADLSLYLGKIYFLSNINFRMKIKNPWIWDHN